MLMEIVLNGLNWPMCLDYVIAIGKTFESLILNEINQQAVRTFIKMQSSFHI